MEATTGPQDCHKLQSVKIATSVKHNKTKYNKTRYGRMKNELRSATQLDSVVPFLLSCQTSSLNTDFTKIVIYLYFKSKEVVTETAIRVCRPEGGALTPSDHSRAQQEDFSSLAKIQAMKSHRSFFLESSWLPCLCECMLSCSVVSNSVSLSSVRGILQARILEWVAVSFSWRSSRPRDETCVSYISCIGRWVLYH